MTFNESSTESWEWLGSTKEIKELKKAIENGVELGDTFFSDMSPFTLNKKILNTYNTIKWKIKRTNIKICSKNNTTMQQHDTIIHKIKNIIPSYNWQWFHTQKIENNDYIYFDPKKFIDAFGNVPLENILTILPINSKILFLVVWYLLASYDEAIKKNENKESFDKYKTFFDQYFSSYQSNKTTSLQEKWWSLWQYGNEIVEKTQKWELEEMKREIVKLMKYIDTTPTYTQKIQQLVQKEIDTYTISQQNNHAVEDNFDVIKMQLLSLKDRLLFLSKQLDRLNDMQWYSAKYDRKNKMYQSEIIITQKNINESIKTTIENCQKITEINFDAIDASIDQFDNFIKNEKIIFLSAWWDWNTDNSSTRRAFLDKKTRSIVDKAQWISNFEFQDFEIWNKTLEQWQKNNLQIEIVPPLSEDMHLRGAVMVTNQWHITKSTSQTTNPNENNSTDEKKNTNATMYTMKITKNGFYKGEVLPLPLWANIQSIKGNEENAGNPLRNLQNEYPSQWDKESWINYNYDSQTWLYRIEDNENNFDQNMEIQFVIDENANINVPTAEDTYFFDHNIPLIQRNNSTVAINQDGTTKQKVSTIQHYINDNSYYWFNDNILLPEYEKDPTTYIQDLIAFYQQWLPGYDGKIQIVCNQSALIAMIMLQQQNIPARMIVWQHYEDPNWPGHAWVEYRDKEEKKRKSMDPTPDNSMPEWIWDNYIPSSWIQDTYINLVERKKYPTWIEILQQTTWYDTTLQKYPRLLQYDPAIEANVVQTDDTKQLYRKWKNEKDEATFENCTIILTQLISYIKWLKKIAWFINNPSLTQIVDIHELFGQLQSFENDKSYIIGEAEAKVKETQLDTIFLDILSKNVLSLNTSQYDLYQQLSQKNGQEIPEKTQEILTEQLFQTLSVEQELEIYTLPWLQDTINQKITEQHWTINKIINNDGIHYTIKTDKADIILRKFNDQRQTKDNKIYKPKEYINRWGETLVTNDANDATFSLHDVGNALLKPLGISKIQTQETNSKVYLKENTSEGKWIWFKNHCGLWIRVCCRLYQIVMMMIYLWY
jgi:hypothetical protein